MFKRNPLLAIGIGDLNAIPFPQQECLSAHLGNLSGNACDVSLLHHQYKVGCRQNRRRCQPTAMGSRVVPALKQKLSGRLINRSADERLKSG